MRRPSSSMKPAAAGKVEVKRGPWTKEEDEILAEYVKKEGEGKWRVLPKKAGLMRCGKSCRLRWMNYLRPSVKHGNISPDEEDLILRLHRLLGNRWSLIAGRIPGRTDNEVKNYWNTHLSKKLISEGIDPTTHKPLKTIYDTDNNVPFPDTASSEAVIETSYRGQEDHGNHQHVEALMCDEEYYGSHQDIHWTRNSSVEEVIVSDDRFALDESLSSFFDSLINEDMFDNQLQDEEKEQELPISNQPCGGDMNQISKGNQEKNG